jgi:hypothetical protein
MLDIHSKNFQTSLIAGIVIGVLGTLLYKLYKRAASEKYVNDVVHTQFCDRFECAFDITSLSSKDQAELESAVITLHTLGQTDKSQITIGKNKFTLNGSKISKD